MLRGVQVQLRDGPSTMSLGDILSRKKVRLSHVRNLSQNEMLLFAEINVHPQQANRVRTTACQAMCSTTVIIWNYGGLSPIQVR